MNKEKKQKEKAYVLKNTLFMLGCAMKCAPLSIIMIYLGQITRNVYNSVVMSVMFLKTAVSIIETGGDYKVFATRIILIIAGKLAIDLLDYFVNFYVRPRFEIKCESYINAMIFKKAQQVELACYENPDFFDKYNRATWVVDKGGFKRVIEGCGWVVGSIASFVSLISYLISIDPVILFFVICPVFVMYFRVKKNDVDFTKEKEMTSYERKKDYIRRTVLLKDFAKEIKTTNIFSVLRRRFNEAIRTNIEVIKKYGWKIAFYEMLSDFFGDVVPVAGGFGYACYRLIVIANLPIADFSVLISAITQCRNKLNFFSRYFTMQQKHCLWVQSLREFLSYEPAITDKGVTPGEFESLEFRNVSFRYTDTADYTLRNVSFTINKGESVAVVGHNGAGKTTLSKLIMRLYDVTEGEILYNGRNIKEYDLSEYRNKFASVFQDYRIFAMTVAENVVMQEIDDKNVSVAERSLTMSGVKGKIYSLPNGINNILTKEFDEDGALLSGGETQKLTIARLFAKDFDIAVLDEPSSALDPVAESKMYDALMEGTKNKTVIYISHRLSSAANSDRVLVFTNGELTEQGSHEELMAAAGAYSEMFTLQASGYKEESD